MSKTLVLLGIVCGFGMAGCTSCTRGPDTVFYADPQTGTTTCYQETFRQRVEARLHDFARSLEALENKASNACANVRATLRWEIDELHRKHEAAHQRWAELCRNCAHRWEERRQHMEATLEDLRAGFERVFSHF